MYLVNTHINKETVNYPDDFPMLTGGKTFAMKKHGDDFIIQTTLGNSRELKRLIELGEVNINTRIAQGRIAAAKLLDQDSYTFDNLSEEEKREEGLCAIYKEDYGILKIHHMF